MDGKIWLRFLAVLVLIAAVAGVAFFAYQAGALHGSPITVQSPNGQSAPYPYFGYGFWPAFPFWGFGCFGPLIALFLLFLALRMVSFIFWGPRWGWGHMGHRAWRHGWYEEGGVPPMFKEMHDRAHGKQPEENKES